MAAADALDIEPGFEPVRVVEHPYRGVGKVELRHAQQPVQRPWLLEGDDEGKLRPLNCCASSRKAPIPAGLFRL